MKNTILAIDITDLQKLIENEIKINGEKCDLNHIDVSNIEDMSGLFNRTIVDKFKGDISRWNVSKVKNMTYMFSNSKFNGDISNWDVSSVENMNFMFLKSEFNSDISKWNVSNVQSMSLMFLASEFNQDISRWDVSNVNDIGRMFESSPFNQDLTNWKPIKLKKKPILFTNSPAPLPYWAKAEDVSSAVRSYWLNKELESSLIDNKSTIAKIKI